MTQTATQTTTELKPSYCRYTLKKQNDRVEYRILSSEADAYYIVQMNNGRAINCYHENGEKCQARHFHPGIPCRHMERANQLEQARREQAKTEAAMQQEPFTSLPAEQQEATAEEVAKCEAAYQKVMAEPIAAQEGTPEYWKAAQKREKRAKAAYRRQRTASQKRLTALAQQNKDLVEQVNAELARVGAELATAEEVAATAARCPVPNADQVSYFVQLHRRSDEYAKKVEAA